MANYPTLAVRAPDLPHDAPRLTLTSETFTAHGTLPNETVFGNCGGDNRSPQLSWSGAPSGTKSYAITCFDPDAPTGAGYWHWLTWNVPASTTSLPLGFGTGDSPSMGVTGTNDYGMRGYGGPCPPPGDGAHRYIFTVYALDVDSLDANGAATTGSTLVFSTRGRVLAVGQITGTWGHEPRA